LICEQESLHESEREYLGAFIHYLSIYGDP